MCGPRLCHRFLGLLEILVILEFRGGGANGAMQEVNVVRVCIELSIINRWRHGRVFAARSFVVSRPFRSATQFSNFHFRIFPPLCRSIFCTCCVDKIAESELPEEGESLFFGLFHLLMKHVPRIMKLANKHTRSGAQVCVCVCLCVWVQGKYLHSMEHNKDIREILCYVGA